MADLRIARQLYLAQLKAGVLGTEASVTPASLMRLREKIEKNIRDIEDLRTAVRILKGPDNSFRPSPRARMTIMAEAAENGRQRAARELDTVWQRGEGERLALLRSSGQAVAERVEARLAPLRDPLVLDGLRHETEQSVDRLLRAEARAQVRAEQVPARELKVARTFSRSGFRPAGMSPAIRLQLIREDILAQVRDLADRRHFVVQLSPTPGVPDRTKEFARLLSFRKGKS